MRAMCAYVCECVPVCVQVNVCACQRVCTDARGHSSCPCCLALNPTPGAPGVSFSSTNESSLVHSPGLGLVLEGKQKREQTLNSELPEGKPSHKSTVVRDAGDQEKAGFEAADSECTAE